MPDDISPDGVVLTQQAPIMVPDAKPAVVEQPITLDSKGEVVETPETPVKEPQVDISAFLKAKDILLPELKQPLVKNEEPKAKEEEDAPIAEATKIVAQPTKTNAKVDPNGRDYSDIPDNEKQLWERMSNEAFNSLRPRIKEYETVKKTLAEKELALTTTNKQLDDARKGIVQVPDNYYEHPSAFVLTPEFTKVSKDIDTATRVLNHWRSSMASVRNGAKEFSIIDVDANGNLKEIGKAPADENAETTLLECFTFAQNQLAQQKAALNVIAKDHTAKHNDAKNWISNIDKQMFPFFEVPETKATYEPLIKDTISKFHPAVQNNPLAMFAAKALLTIHEQQRLLTQAAQEKINGGKAPTTVKKPVAAKVTGGPSSAEIAGEVGEPTKSNPRENIDVEDFKRAKGLI